MKTSKLGLRIAIAATATTTALALTSTHMVLAQENADLLNSVEALAEVPSDLVVTEILPDNTSYDNFEFFEVHNTGSAPVTIGEGEYTFAYSYDDAADTTRDNPLSLGEAVTVAAGETIVVWMEYTSSTVDTSALSEQEFRDFYDMDSSARIFRATGQAGLANGGNRGIRILYNNEVSQWAHYPAGSAAVQKGIDFAVPALGEQASPAVRTQTDPTPGVVTADQLIPGGVELPVEPELPVDPTDSLFDGLTSPINAAPLIITELMANSTNIGGSDGFEYIEVSNTTDEPVDFSNFTLNYLYPQDEFTNTNTAVWAAEPGDVVIQPGKSLVFWVKNGPNDSSTAADFNAEYGTNLEAGKDLVEISSGGMANGSARGMQIQTNTGHIVNRAYYNMAGASDVKANEGLHYGVDEADLLKQTLIGSGAPTPGSAHAVQLPSTLISVVADSSAPTIVDNTLESIDPSQPFTFSFNITDDIAVRTATLQVTSSAGEEATQVNLIDEDGTFSWELPAADLTGKSWFEYSLSVTDGFNNTTTEPVRITVDGANTDPLRLNLEENQWVSGTTDIIGASDTFGDELELLIDDAPAPTRSSLSAAPTFAMEVTQTDVFFRNGILAGEKELHIFDKGTYSRIETISTAVPLYHINEDGSLTVSVYAGTKAAPGIDLNENNDDFQIRNLRLILPDGRTLTPAGISDSNAWLNMGDSAGKLDFIDATFQLPEDSFTGVSHTWDTTKLADGDHNITISKAAGESISRTVRVDNTGPELHVTGVEDGQELRGTVNIDAQADDAGAGLKTIETLLDGERVELPLATGSLALNQGEHTLVIRAEDEVGNRTEKTITFSTPDENPISGDYAPSHGATVDAGDVTLSARATDPSGDAVTMTFLEADTPQLASGRIRTSSGAVENAAGIQRKEAKALSQEDVDKLAGTADGLSLEVASDTALPYQLFEVDAAAELADDTDVRLNWAGAADSRAQVIMYVFNGTSWVELDRHLTGDAQEEFKLQGIVNASEYAIDGTVTVLIQHSEGFAGADLSTRASAVTPAHAEDVPRSDYDFTLAWESDTQYYNEEFHEHQTKIHDYILAERENKNIQFLFHTGDVVDNWDQPEQWAAANPEYQRLDEAGLPYSVLAGNHDVDHANDDFTEFSRHFGEQRYADNPWYTESYRDNRGHYDLFSAGGIDFINVAMGWAPDDDAIAWMNEVLAKHPERVAILNLHEFMLTTGGLGPIPQRILDEVAGTNPNVRMIMSGHYHDAYQRTDSFDDDGDGVDDRTVTSMLFDYQGLPEGGQGYLRLMHFDNEGQKMMVRTYSPSLEDYNSEEASLMGPAENPNLYQEFDISYEQLGITPEGRTLISDSFSADFLTSNEIGTVQDVPSGAVASVVWNAVSEGRHDWYVRSEDPFRGAEISPVQSFIAGEEALGEGPTSGSSNGSSSSTGLWGAVAGFFAGAAALAGAAVAFVPGIWDYVVNAFKR
ncbi:lamin tail domain-containing protein [Corynebacterium crudilactis]|uniref:Phosphoesterase n=1 Tax=Corynebacterium crudilactis TaxID=1652495 RepID=A0A172QWS6_9CORY|nr:lamin tail domain-containing protein [Corynebacterium crudilactis]ANE05163.1 phosphoesterase [Corynebacterium crudilactis]